MTESQKTAFTASDIDAMAQRYRANFINSLSGFKAAALLGTTDGTTDNLAVVSSVVHIGANPPLLGMIMRPHTVERHSLQNIKDRKMYTLNQIAADITGKAHQTSARYPQNTSEFTATGLTAWYSADFAAPFVAESPLNIGLEVAEHLTLCNKTELVIGRIRQVHVNRAAIAGDGYLDLEQLDIACISGLDSYHRTQRIAQYAYAKPDEPVREKTPPE
ncbi:flavin reductase family protein [Alteromonas sp. CYL-A6]|uniref:flavin reductase family protein n=1 Tax=Alteromonas nitratireducens TaxID=3390813 RepID=UPI0034A9F3BC